MKQRKLAPCPLCGARITESNIVKGRYYYHIRCKCGFESAGYEDRNWLIESWNTAMEVRK